MDLLLTGIHFIPLRNENGEIVLCLHPWEMDEHPAMITPAIKCGNGIILYFKTKHIEIIYQQVQKTGIPLEKNYIPIQDRKKRIFIKRPRRVLYYRFGISRIWQLKCLNSKRL